MNENKSIPADQLEKTFKELEELEKQAAEDEASKELVEALIEHCSVDPDGRLTRALIRWEKELRKASNAVARLSQQAKALPESVRAFLAERIAKAAAHFLESGEKVLADAALAPHQLLV